MSILTDRRRFEALRARYLVARAAHDTYRGILQHRYQLAAYAPGPKRQRLDRLARACGRLREAFFAHLTRVSPRHGWDAGVPADWVLTKLTWADATTRAALTIEPPAAWGYDRSWIRQHLMPALPDETRR